METTDPVKRQNIRIPKRLQLETVYGCNAKCGMCAISLPPTRKIGPMPIEISTRILDEFAPYCDRIEKVDLFGLGEPLLDPFLFDRIKYAKEKGFRSVAISTNADLLNPEKQKKLLDSGIDAVIFSIDGIKKETHEGIRRNVKFERVVQNCIDTIRMRDEGGYKTRFVVRFIRQKSNIDEWEEYKAFWKQRLSHEKGDQLIAYDVNTMGGEVLTKEELVSSLNMDIEKKPCHMVFERLIVLADGTVPLCCEDTPRATHALGNVLQAAPIEIFNSEKFDRIRDIHLAGEKNSIPICKGCTVLYSEKNTEVVDLSKNG